MEIQYGNLAALNWLWLVALCAVVFVLDWIRRGSQMRSFATSRQLRVLVPHPYRYWRAMQFALLSIGMVFLVAGLVDLRWGKQSREVPQRGIEVMFVLDVSRSMFAEDASPNRLARAKQQIGDMLTAMQGDRIGLTVFAGEVRQVVPMTSHYDDFKRTLGDANPDVLRRGGSRLGDAIRVAAEGFLTKTNDHKAMVIFTDGEDQESEPVKVAKQIYMEKGVRIFTVGLGDMTTGARIPLSSENAKDYVQYDGQQVWSKLDGEILKSVATETDGAFIPAETKQVDMASVYRKYVSRVEQQEFETATIDQYEARYQWFVGTAFACLFVGLMISHRKVNS